MFSTLLLFLFDNFEQVFGWRGLKVSLQTLIQPFQCSFAFRLETSHLICNTNQMTGFYMKCNTGQK